MKLAPFTPYMSKPTTESRQAIARQIMNPADDLTDQIIEGLIQVVAMEGPILTTRAFKLYAKKGGMAKLSPAAAKRFTSALKKAIHAGKISIEVDISTDNTIGLLWLPTMQRVVVREYGARGFDDIPASELGELMFELASEVGEDKPSLYQKITELYGLKQLSASATARLDLVYQEYLS